ncbi:MAG: adenylate kinase [Sciscionella sp.]|nr:adenylate kinase [Sciscionella sp.]
MRLVLVGAPGAGKGTQADLLSKRLGIPHISTGDLFRAHVGDGTELGAEVKRYLDAGKLVPDELTNEMVRERLAEPDVEPGFILDGFPRNVGQAEVLAGMLSERGEKLDAVLQFDVPEDVVVDRLLARGRADDTEDVIRRRQQVYREETEPLLRFYAPILVHVDAVGEIDEIHARAVQALHERG